MKNRYHGWKNTHTFNSDGWTTGGFCFWEDTIFPQIKTGC